ncbi:645_t:CDS:2 [Entrophospora sp. SA101]|nr:645_t:CDS:2 [Entrophospora sp. SA101]
MVLIVGVEPTTYRLQGGLTTIIEELEELEIPFEEQFILRLSLPADIKQRFRAKIKDKKIENVVKIVFKDPRRAIFTFENKDYNARLVDLPCIVESQKTFNGGQLYKIADICQMLIVEGEEFTENTESSNIDEFEWQDGITPPLKNVRKTRFRKRISNKKLEEIEMALQQLLHDDSLAEEVKLEWVDLDAVNSESTTPVDVDGSKQPEGEDTGQQEDIDSIDEFLLKEFERQIDMMENLSSDNDESNDESDDESDDESNEEFDEEGILGKEEEEEGEEGEDEEEEDDEDDEEDEEDTEESSNEEQLAELESLLKKKETDLTKSNNPVMTERIVSQIADIKEEMEKRKKK